MSTSKPIWLIVQIKVKEANKEAIQPVFKEIVEKSRSEKGCFQYDLITSDQNPLEYAIVEHWENDESLDNHNKAEHKIRCGKKLGEYSESISLQRYSMTFPRP